MKKPSTGAMIGVIAAMTIGSAVIFGGTWALFMHTETVEPGHHGVIIDKPYFWGNEGVRKEPLTDGRKLLWRTSSLQAVRMTPQSIPVKVDDYSSSDNILLDFETTIQVRVIDAVRLVGEFGDGWFDNNIKQQYLAIVRDAVKKRTMTDMMSNVKTAKDIDDEITAALNSLIKDAKLPIALIGVSTGRAKPNEAVLLQMNETAAQQQRQKTLVAATLAEIDRKKEQVAKAEADNAYRNAMGLSPDMFIQLESIKRWSEACLKAATCIVNPNGQVLNVHGK
jgi:regulator of protease activity HflC (stomatin/prohibitin superfamily)